MARSAARIAASAPNASTAVKTDPFTVTIAAIDGDFTAGTANATTGAITGKVTARDPDGNPLSYSGLTPAQGWNRPDLERFISTQLSTYHRSTQLLAAGPSSGQSTVQGERASYARCRGKSTSRRSACQAGLRPQA
jgi:hypothetical protein